MDKDKINGARWLCFSLDTDEDKAAERFRERFGQPPDEIIEYKSWLLVGPIQAEREPGSPPETG